MCTSVNANGHSASDFSIILVVVKLAMYSVPSEPSTLLKSGMRQLSTKFIFTVFINAPVCRSHFSWLFTETQNQLIGTGKVSNVIVNRHTVALT